MNSFPPARSWLGAAVVCAGIAYPFFVYFGLRFLPPVAIVGGLLALLALRWGISGFSPMLRPLLVVLGGTGLSVVGIATLAPLMSLKAYPVLLNIGIAVLFGCSLYRPPTAIERLARLREPDLPATAVGYLRKVTIVWLCFFLINGAISAATAFWGSLAAWTLYNGLISYLLIGSLLAGEYAVRTVVQRRRREAE